MSAISSGDGSDPLSSSSWDIIPDHGGAETPLPMRHTQTSRGFPGPEGTPSLLGSPADTAFNMAQMQPVSQGVHYPPHPPTTAQDNLGHPNNVGVNAMYVPSQYAGSLPPVGHAVWTNPVEQIPVQNSSMTFNEMAFGEELFPDNYGSGGMPPGATSGHSALPPRAQWGGKYHHPPHFGQYGRGP